MSTAQNPTGVGVIGAGTISGAYLATLTRMPALVVHAVGDVRPEAARQRAEQFTVPTWGGPEAVLEHPEVSIVVNLTTVRAHADVALAALAAGKHVYNEKPLAHDLAGAAEMLTVADAAGLRVGCAPDTFLAPGIQLALEMIRRGDIGTPLGALILEQSPGPDRRQHHPDQFFAHGAGPVHDKGPYYFATLMQALGPARTVSATAAQPRERRTVRTGPRAGQSFQVTVPTHVNALLDFGAGGGGRVSANAVLSFDSAVRRTGVLEITGTEGVLAFPPPGRFDGPVRLWRESADDWEIVAEPEFDGQRGLGVLDLARSIAEGVPHRASADLAYHVLEVMDGIRAGADSGSVVEIGSTFAPVERLPQGWDPWARSR